MMGQGDNYDYSYALRVNNRNACGCWKGYEEAIGKLKKKIEKLEVIIKKLKAENKSNKLNKVIYSRT